MKDPNTKIGTWDQVEALEKAISDLNGGRKFILSAGPDPDNMHKYVINAFELDDDGKIIQPDPEPVTC